MFDKLTQEIKKQYGNLFFHLQIQSTMHTIEQYLHEPFEEVVLVSSNSGSEDGAYCILKSYQKETEQFYFKLHDMTSSSDKQEMHL